MPVEKLCRNGNSLSGTVKCTDTTEVYECRVRRRKGGKKATVPGKNPPTHCGGKGVLRRGYVATAPLGEGRRGGARRPPGRPLPTSPPDCVATLSYTTDRFCVRIGHVLTLGSFSSRTLDVFVLTSRGTILSSLFFSPHWIRSFLSFRHHTRGAWWHWENK